MTEDCAGQQVSGLLPPLVIASSTHPDASLVYNDDFSAAGFAWERPFPTTSGYYELVDANAINVPVPATGTLVTTELVAVPRNKFVNGSNYFHIVSVSAGSTIGTVENTFQVRINTLPPVLSSLSHPSSTTWSADHSPFFSWTIPVADANEQGFYVVLDHYGTTVPTGAATLLPVSQKTLVRAGLADGVWALHVVAVDTRGYLTKAAGHYRVRLGANPGAGAVSGAITNAAGPVSGAKITINRGLFNFAGEAPDQTTAANGTYVFPSTIPVGTWEITVTDAMGVTKTQSVVVTANNTTAANITLP